MSQKSICIATRVVGMGNTVFFTGAGMSADSGLETYRDKETGLWENVDPNALASIDSWAKDPEPMFAHYTWRSIVSNSVEPNAGHQAIGAAHLPVITQNIDNLHERGGSEEVVHLHGSLFKWKCTICGRPYKYTLPEWTEPRERLAPPECPLCHNPIRPEVTWFDEALPEQAWNRAVELLQDCDTLVIVGTSGTVQPAASLPLVALDNGARLYEVSPQPTTLTPLVHEYISATAATGVPALLEKLL
ncbi:NAD-dependent deacylase [Corynebacterium pyruviciproducens]|uniref:NAD-dependent deacylase n=1 Tax=Corynebacterium pyruviciproducens TaxID=598660 RepID=UPI003B00D83D